MIKKYYGYFAVAGLMLFACVGAYYSTPILPDVEIEFKGSIRKDIHKPTPPVSPVRKYQLNI